MDKSFQQLRHRQQTCRNHEILLLGWSALNMDLFDSKRQERLEAARKASTASKEAARAFLIRAGILLPNGEVAPHLR